MTHSVWGRCAKGIISSALEGQNGTIFVYGQTSSGKTHTMQGNEQSPGIVPLGISYIFDEVKKRATTVDFLVRCSYVEIYNENITDLLNPKNTNLKLHTNAKGGCFVGGVTETVIANAAQATELISKGMANRSVGETKMNSESSRSHSLLRFVIESRDKSDASGAVRIAELNLVDLAGSERQSHTQATGTRLKEGANINKSLLTLSNVIAKLSEGAAGQHIPYRDSKLTRVLERALGGNSRTSIICTVTNAAVHAEETLSTLKFATRAKTIKNKAEVNEVLDDQAMLRKYKKEIDNLKKKLRYTSAGGEKDMEICQMINQLQSLQDENAALECEKQELIGAVAEKEHKMNKLTDLVISAGANMSMQDAANAHARKVKATSRQSWCPGAMAGGGFGNFAAFPSKAASNKAAMASGIEEGDETMAEEDGHEAHDKRKLSDSCMSLCSASGDEAAAEEAAAAAIEIERLNVLVTSLLAAAAAQASGAVDGGVVVEALQQDLASLTAAKTQLLDQVAALECALADKEDMLKQTAEGAEAAVSALSQELEQVKLHKAALTQEATELKAMADGTRLQLIQAQGLMQEEQELAQQSAAELEEQRKSGSAAAAVAEQEMEKLKAQLVKAEEAAGKAAEAAATAHGTVVQGLQDMLLQSEADYTVLKTGKEELEAQLSQVQREVEALKETAAETQFQMERERNRLEEANEKAAADLKRLQEEQDQLMMKVVDLEEELDTVKNERQELVLQVQELQDDNDELNAIVKKASGVANKRMSVYGGGVKNEGSFDARRQSMANSSRMSIAPGMGMGSSTANADAAQLRREMGIKEQRCADLEKAKDKLEKAHESLKVELAGLKEEASNGKKELKKTATKVASLERAKDDAEKEIEKLKNKLGASEEKMKQLGQERSSLAADKASSERELRMASSKLEALDKEAEKLRATNLKMKETQSSIAAAEKKAAACEAEEQRMAAELEAKSTELQSTQADLLACADERDELEMQHQEIVAAHAKATMELSDLSAQQCELEKLCEDMKDELKSLESKLAAATSSSQALQKDLDDEVKLTGSLREQIKGKDASLAANAKSMSVLQEDLEEAEKQVDLMTQRIENNKSEMSRLQRMEASNGDLQENITSVRAEKQAALDEVADAKFEIQQLQAEAQAAAAEHERERAKLEAQVTRGNEQVVALEEDKERLRRQFIEFSDTKDLIAASEGLEKRIAELETALQAEHLTVQKCQGEVEHIKAEKKELQVQAEELKVLKREHDVVKRDLEEAKAALMKQEDQANKLSSALEQRLATAASEMSELKVSLARGNEENKLQIQELYHLRAVNEATRQEMDRNISEQTAGGDRMLQRIKDLSDKSEKAECSREKAECQVARMTEQMQHLETTHQSLAQSLKSSEEMVGELKEVGLKMQAALELKESELANVTHAKEIELANVKQARQQLEEQLGEAKVAAKQLRDELKECEGKLQQVEKEHGKCEAIPELKNELKQAQQRCQELQLEVSKLSSKCELVEQDRASTQRMLESKDSSGVQVMSTVTKLSDELQEARTLSATLQLQLDQALRQGADKDELVASLQDAGIKMEVALTQQLHESDELKAQLVAALADREAVRSEMELKIAAAAENAAAAQEKQALGQDLTAARQELKAAQQEVASLKAKSSAETNVILESCEKRMRMLEYDLVSKAQEQQKLEKVRDEAFHKMTVMKAEYTGRVKRRDDKIAQLEAKLANLTGVPAPAPFADADADADKENHGPAFDLQGNTNAQGAQGNTNSQTNASNNNSRASNKSINTSQTKASAAKTPAAEPQEATTEKRSTRSSRSKF